MSVFGYYLDPKTKSIVDKTQKNKKALLDINYDEVKEEKDFAKFFKPSKSLTLTKSTLSKYSKVKNTLPKDLHYDADKLFRLFCKGQVMVSYICLFDRNQNIHNRT